MNQKGVYILDWKRMAKKWLQYEFLDEVVKGQLDRIKSDEKSMEEAFYKSSLMIHATFLRNLRWRRQKRWQLEAFKPTYLKS